MTGRGSRDFHSSHNHNKSPAQQPAANDNHLSPDATDGPTLSTLQSNSTTTSTTTAVTPTQPTSTTSSGTGGQSRAILDLPAVRFLMRTDFFNLMHMNDEALAQYNSSSSLKHMVTKIRREGQHSLTNAFERYQHNRDLVSLINKFAETNKDLPPGALT